MKDILVELGLFNLENIINSPQENSLEDKTNENSNDKNKDDNNTKNNTEMESSSIDMQQKVSLEKGDELGDDSDESDLEYFPKIESLEKIGDYKIYTNKFDEIINANELCDLKELEKLRYNLDQQVFAF